MCCWTVPSWTQFSSTKGRGRKVWKHWRLVCSKRTSSADGCKRNIPALELDGNWNYSHKVQLSVIKPFVKSDFILVGSCWTVVTSFPKTVRHECDQIDSSTKILSFYTNINTVYIHNLWSNIHLYPYFVFFCCSAACTAAYSCNIRRHVGNPSGSQLCINILNGYGNQSILTWLSFWRQITTSASPLSWCITTGWSEQSLTPL